MHPITTSDLRAAVGGIHLAGPTAGTLGGDAAAVAVEAVCTDTREMKPRSAFVALRGERFDGHEHLAAARAGGAIVAVVERVPDGFVPPPPGFHLIRVADTYAALGAVARLVRLRLGGRVVAVAGSNGKTGTKLLVHAALSGTLRGSVSPKSYNNNVGVPLAIFPADPADDYLVLELGTNHPGEIAPLTAMAEPDVAVITNAGAEHLEGLKDLDGVRAENATVVRGLRPGGLLVVNGDDPTLVAACAAAGWAGDRVTFGFDPANDLSAAGVVAGADGVRFTVVDRAAGRRTPAFVPLLGRHTASNALAALAVARRLGVPDADALAGLAAAPGPDMRLQLAVTPAGVRVLNDAYNANPSSMRAALETLAGLDASGGPDGRVGRRAAVLGDMRELGETSERYHRELGEQAAAAGLAWLACIGPESRATADAAVAAGMPAAAVHRFADAAAAAAVGAVPTLARPGDLVLVKASRGIGLEVVAAAIGRG